MVDTDTVTVSNLDYLNNTSILISQTSTRTLQNYMIWRFMMELVQYMPSKFRAVKATFDKVVQNTISTDSREVTCGTYTNNFMGFVVGKLYTQKYINKSDVDEVIL